MTALAIAVLATIGGAIGGLIVATLRWRRRDAQVLELLAIFGPVAERARSDPRVLLAWYPAAQAARLSFPEAFAVLDRGDRDRFPFGAPAVEAAHARWTADWLAWEGDHETEYREKIEAVEAAHDPSGDAAARRLVDTLEREKLGRYQRRYEEYVRVSRAMGELTGSAEGDRGGGAPR